MLSMAAEAQAREIIRALALEKNDDANQGDHADDCWLCNGLDKIEHHALRSTEHVGAGRGTLAIENNRHIHDTAAQMRKTHRSDLAIDMEPDQDDAAAKLAKSWPLPMSGRDGLGFWKAITKARQNPIIEERPR
jgi:hypothetical protein